MTIWVGTTTSDLEIYGGGIDKINCHMPLLKYNGKRWRYRDDVIGWYTEPTEQEKFATKQWLEEKGQIVKRQYTLTDAKQTMYFHGKEDASLFYIR